MTATTRRTRTAKPKAEPDNAIVFVVDRETPGTFRFAEIGAPETHKSGAIYLKKGFLKKLGVTSPKGVRITVEVE